MPRLTCFFHMLFSWKIIPPRPQINYGLLWLTSFAHPSGVCCLWCIHHQIFHDFFPPPIFLIVFLARNPFPLRRSFTFDEPLIRMTISPFSAHTQLRRWQWDSPGPSQSQEHWEQWETQNRGRHAEAPGVIWRHVEARGDIWRHVEAPGVM